MEYYIVSFSRNWADEFNVKGSRLYTEYEWAAEELTLADKSKYWVSMYFGTNEGWEDEELSAFAQSYKIAVISETTYNELVYKNLKEFGTFFAPSELIAEESE